MNKPVLCFGEILWDTFPEGKKPGGAPMNVAMHLRQQGIDAMMASRIGADEPGKELQTFLIKNNLFSELIQTDDILPTCVVTVKLDDQQRATYTIPYPVSWDHILPETPLMETAKQADLIVFGSLVCRDHISRNTLIDILSSDAMKVFDVNLRAPHYDIKHLKALGGMANIIKMNDEELDMLAGTELAHLSQKEKILFLADYFGCETICITRGNAGAIALLNGDFYEHPGYKVNVIDTVGSGDAFLASFIAGMLKQEAPELLLQKACALGAFVAEHRGATPNHDMVQISEIISRGV